MARDGVRRAVGVILAPHATEASRERYVEAVDEGRARARAARARRSTTSAVARAPALRRGGGRRSVRAALAGLPARRARSSSRRTASRVAAAERSPYVAEIDGDGARRSPRGSAARPGSSPTRAAAATRATRGSSPTSTTSLRALAADGRARRRRGADRLRLRPRRGALRPRRRGARDGGGARPRLRARQHGERPPALHPHAGRAWCGSAPRDAAGASWSSAAGSPGSPRRTGSSSTRRRARRSTSSCSRPPTASAAASPPSAAAASSLERGRRLHHHREAVGRWRSASASASPTGSSARARASAAPTSCTAAACTPLPEGFLLLAPTALVAAGDVAALLLARQAPHGARPGAAAPRRTTATRASAAFVRRRLGERGAGARRRAARRRHLHRRPRAPVARRHDAALPASSSAAPQRDPRPARDDARCRAAAPARATACSSRPPTAWARWSTPIARRLPEGVVRLRHARCEALARDGERWRVRAGGGSARRRRASSSPRPAFAAARLLAPLDAELGARARRHRVRLVGDRDARLPRRGRAGPLAGFGFVVPFAERRPLLACTFASRKYPGPRAGGARAAARLRRRRAPARAGRRWTTTRWWRPCAPSCARCSASRAEPVLVRVAPLPPRDAAVRGRAPRPRGGDRARARRRCPASRWRARPTAASASPTACAAARRPRTRW